MTRAETDMPFDNRDRWPAEVVAAGELLCDRFVPVAKHANTYRQTGVVAVDDATRHAFVVFVPYAFDAALWDSERVHLAHLSDEGTAVRAALTEQEHRQLCSEFGTEHLVNVREWRRQNPSYVRRLLRVVTLRR